MICAIADNIISPLGLTTEANLKAVKEGRTALCSHTSVHGERLHESFIGSLFEDLPLLPGMTAFESLCVKSVEQVLISSGIDATDTSCVFVLSTTKGNIWSSPAESAAKIASYFGNKSTPIVVSTACTSGVSAQIVAWRLLMLGVYKTAIVVGCDVQSEFVVSGFQSFNALSNQICRPFDKSRNGLNAGEAVATLVLSTEREGKWQLIGGSIHNDANHISGPSRTAEGSLRCLEDAKNMADPADWAFISVHGTGTLYNDEMESIAISRAGLSQIPVSALKGNYGHTMGAAGLLETILSLHAADEGIILPVKGYVEQGTTYPVNISSKARKTNGNTFVKLLSGFGGVNSVVVWRKTESCCNPATLEIPEYSIVEEISLSEKDDLVQLYRSQIGDYPKFFKMDLLSRAGFVGVELLLKKANVVLDGESTAVVMANYSSSLKNDTDYQATISDAANYFPSPALFVYTLPNIVTGELAIRHHIFGETAFYLLPSEEDINPLITTTFLNPQTKMAIVGWVECPSAKCWNAHFRLIMRK